LLQVESPPRRMLHSWCNSVAMVCLCKSSTPLFWSDSSRH
jgi:hypothetical protein